MKTKFNPHLFLWALGILQPATPRQVQHLLEYSFQDSGIQPSYKTIADTFAQWAEFGVVIPVGDPSPIRYSLSLTGNQIIPKTVRFNKDKTRLFALKTARKRASRASEIGILNSAGDSPSDTSRLVLQERRPELAASAPRSYGQFWPSPYKQLFPTAGKKSSSTEARLPLLSFSTRSELARAIHGKVTSNRDLGLTEIAICMGISPNLILSIVKHKEKHYRTFQIPKKSGGNRTINAPRVFLKTIQRWICDYILCEIPIHDACHAYRSGRSILSNATQHVGKKYVANIDISDFFTSISNYEIVDHFSPLMSDRCVFAIEELCTLNGSTPQGAPTSPTISNSILYSFDAEMTAYSSNKNIEYTRYADDITISGDCRNDISLLIDYADSRLAEYGYGLNAKKTRIASHNDQQRVTGVVVNEKPQPTRKKRKRIRAAFHSAKCNPTKWVGDIHVLQGYINYLQSFPCLKNSCAITSYKDILNIVRSCSS